VRDAALGCGVLESTLDGVSCLEDRAGGDRTRHAVRSATTSPTSNDRSAQDEPAGRVDAVVIAPEAPQAPIPARCRR
jgi:hypothetical protein